MSTKQIINHCFYFEVEKLEMLTAVISNIDGGEYKITYSELKRMQSAIAILEGIAMIPDLDQFYESRFIDLENDLFKEG